MVLIDKLHKREVYLYLIKEGKKQFLMKGVIVLKKDFSQTEHKQTKVPNLHVWMLLRSLKDRDYVTLVFNWQYYYYFLNQKGHEYLTNFLGLTDNVVPNTWVKNSKTYEIRDKEGFKPKTTHGTGGRPERGEGFKAGRGRRTQGRETAGDTKPGDAPTTTTPVEPTTSS